MTFSDFTKRTTKHFLMKKAAREIRQEIEKAGLKNLITLCENGISIVTTYLNGCSPQEQAAYRRDLNTLLQMGVTADMVLEEIARQMPKIVPIMERQLDYKKMEIENLEAFLRGGQVAKK